MEKWKNGKIMSTNMLKKYYSQKLADKRRIPKPRVDNYLYEIEDRAQKRLIG